MALEKTKINGFGIVLSVLMGAALTAFLHPDFVHAAMVLPSTENLDVPAPQGETAIQKLEDLLGPIARNLRIIIGAIAVLLIVIAGFQMVISGENEETVKNQRKSITYGVIGLMMISIAGPVASIFDYRRGNFMDDPEKFIERAQVFDNTTRLIIVFLKYILGTAATLMCVRSGAIMVMSGANEEDVTREKKSLMLSAGGLFMVFVSEMVITKIFYSAEFNTETSETVVSIDQNEFVRQLVGFTNLLVTFVGPVMMFGIVAGGLLYVASFGNEERTALAKKIIMNSMIGVVIIYGAFALVSTVIAGAF